MQSIRWGNAKVIRSSYYVAEKPADLALNNTHSLSHTLPTNAKQSLLCTLVLLFTFRR